MKYLPTFFYLLQLLLYYLAKDVCTQGNIKNVVVKVLKSNCTGNNCLNKYLQICYNQEDLLCSGRMSVICLEPTDHNIKKTDLKAIGGSKLRYEFSEEISRIKDIIVGITMTSATSLYPTATSCETTRTQTTNGFRVNTSSADGIYKLEILIEVECSTSTCSGQNCEICGLTTNVPTDMVNTSFISRRSPTTLSTLYSTSLLTSTVTNNRTTTSLINSTSNFKNSENPSKRSQTITVTVISVASILVISIVLILIFICYRKHKRKSKTTPAEDDKNHLVNDYTEGKDRHSSTDYSNGVQNNKVNLHIENESCDKMAISISEDFFNHNFPADEKNEIANEKKNGYVPDDEHSDENEEQGKIKTDEIAVSSPVDNKINENQEIESKSKSNSQNEDIKLRKSMEDENPSSSDGGQNNRTMTHSEDVSGNDGPSSDNGDVPRQAQYNGDVPHQAQSNGDVPHQAQSNSDVTYQAQFNGDVPHQAQSNGDFHHQEISRNDIENIAKVNVETFIHGQMSEMRRDMTEHTNNTINQVREEVLTFQHDITEKMLQQSNEFKEEVNKTTEVSEKAEGKRQRKMQKLGDQIEECNERLRIVENRNDECIPNQKLLEKKVEASGGKQDNATSEIIENKNEIQKLRDEMNRLSEILRQQISQQKPVVSVPDTPFLTRTTHVGESSPHSNNLLRSRIASDDALYSKHSGSLTTPDQYSELEKKRKKKKKKRTPSIHFPGGGTVHIQHEENSIDIEQIGPMEVQHVSRGIRLTGGNIEIDIKSPRKKIITPKPQKDQST